MSYRGFEGINLQKTHSGDESISLIENFRICADGSLKKRPGWESVCRTPGNVSKSFRTTIHEKEIHYLLCENLILKYTPDDASITTLFEIPEYSSAHFFEYLGDTYLLCDTGIYKITESGAEEAITYIPLYGKDWPSSRPGEIYEPINLLCNKVIISYDFVAPTHGFLSKGDLVVTNIDAIYRNGELLSPEKYYYDEEFDAITLLEHEDGDKFIAIYSIAQSEKVLDQKNSLFSTRDTATFYELNNHTLLLWGDRESNRVFYSKKVSEESRQAYGNYLSNENSLYIPFDSFFTVDKPSSRVNAIIRHYDRVLIMTDTSTWMTDLQHLGSKDFQLKSINASLGCGTPGAIRVDNSIISINANQVYCWRSNTDELNECNAYCISSPIQGLIENDFFNKCMMKVNAKNGEIWFYKPSALSTWIYNINRSAWYTYSGFYAYTFLDSDTEMIFSQTLTLNRFKEAILYDGGEKISATFKSGELEFNSMKYKKTRLVVIRGEFTGGGIIIKLSFDNGKTLSYTLAPPKKHFVLPVRIRSGSFKSVSINVLAYGAGEQTIHGIELYAK